MLRALPIGLVVVMLWAGCVERAGQPELGPQAAIRFASEVRQLPALGPIRGGWLEPEALAERIDAMLTPEDRAATDAFGRMLGDLGVFAGERPLTDLMLEAMAAQIAGFYDPKEKVLYAIRRPSTMPLERTTVLVHEGVHALQDQHGLLPGFGDGHAVPGLDDLDGAQQAAIEGDATVAMVMGLVRYGGGSRRDEAQAVGQAALMINAAIRAFVDKEKVHPVVAEALAFPYAAGFTWVVFGPFRDGGWAAVDAALRAPPPSTELILHPARAGSGDWPIMVGFDPGPAVPAARFEEGATSVLGERWHRFVFAHYGQPMAAAEGWGGDRVRHFRERTTGRTLTLVATRWDTPADADQAEAAWAAATPPSGVSSRLGMRRDGQRLVLAFGRADVDVAAALAAMLDTWREAPIRDRAAGLAFLADEAGRR